MIDDENARLSRTHLFVCCFNQDSTNQLANFRNRFLVLDGHLRIVVKVNKIYGALVGMDREIPKCRGKRQAS